MSIVNAQVGDVCLFSPEEPGLRSGSRIHIQGVRTKLPVADLVSSIWCPKAISTMRSPVPFLLTLLIIPAFFACQSRSGSDQGGNAERVARFAEGPGQLDDYWYQGEAEISSYHLRQNRYRGVHPGEAVLIFVTEDFLTEEQVKNERYTNPNSTSVLKLNMIRRFTTGIYDYSIMTSVFTPVDTKEYPYTLKVTNSSQDWCGQSFMQINQERKRYLVRTFSYFEEEGDQSDRTPAEPLEDELFNRVRMNPDGLPTGSFTMYPSTTYCRLNHLPFSPQKVEAALRDYEGENFERPGLREYHVDFPEIGRKLSIVFEAEAPYRIAGWTEAYPSLLDGLERKTIAKRKKTLKTPYWKQNQRKDMVWRDSLELEGR